jgi:hypothetical protein
MENYIDFSTLPILESEENDTVFGVREDGEFVRCSYYIKPQVDYMITATSSNLSDKITNTEVRLTAMIQNVRKETVDIIGNANNRLSNI